MPAFVYWVGRQAKIATARSDSELYKREYRVHKHRCDDSTVICHGPDEGILLQFLLPTGPALATHAFINQISA